jgi:hypothetical protein
VPRECRPPLADGESERLPVKDAGDAIAFTQGQQPLGSARGVACVSLRQRQRHCASVGRGDEPAVAGGVPAAAGRKACRCEQRAVGAQDRHVPLGADPDQAARERFEPRPRAGSVSDLEALFQLHWLRAYRAAYLVCQDMSRVRPPGHVPLSLVGW